MTQLEMSQLEDTLRRAESMPTSLRAKDVRGRVEQRQRRRRRRRGGAALAVVGLTSLGGAAWLAAGDPAEITVAASGSGDDTPSPTPTTTTTGAAIPAASPSVDLISIEASSTSSEGTTGVTLVFDNALPDTAAIVVDSLDAPGPPQLAYTTQSSAVDDEISVCGDAHWFPPPGNRTVDVLIPSAWLAFDAGLEPGPVVWDPAATAPAKIIICEPRDGFVQISIWGAASAQVADVGVVVENHRVEIAIAPNPNGAQSSGHEADLSSVAADQWVYPTLVPEGLDFAYSSTSRNVRHTIFEGHNGKTLNVSFWSADLSALADDATPTEVEIAGNTWLGDGQRGFRLETETGWIHVSGFDLAPGVLTDVIESLHVIAATALPRGPIDTENGTFVDVAVARSNERTATLQAMTDGAYYATGSTGAGRTVGCCTRLPTDEAIRLTLGLGPTPDGSVGFLGAIVDESVATIEVRLTDGSVITTEPQDLLDSFRDNFMLVAIPTTDGELFESVEVVVAFDELGDELGRDTGLSTPSS